MNITAHIVVRDADRAAAWYAQALGAEERSRIPLPGGKLMSVELAFGDSTVMVADEFPEAGVLSPLSTRDWYVFIVAFALAGQLEWLVPAAAVGAQVFWVAGLVALVRVLGRVPCLQAPP